MSQSAESIYSNSRWLSGACCGFEQAPLDVWGNWRNKSKNVDYLISHDEGDSRWTKYEVLSVNLRLPAMNTHSTGVSFRPFKVCLFFEFHIVNIAKTATSVEAKTNLKKRARRTPVGPLRCGRRARGFCHEQQEKGNYTALTGRNRAATESRRRQPGTSQRPLARQRRRECRRQLCVAMTATASGLNSKAPAELKSDRARPTGVRLEGTLAMLIPHHGRTIKN